MLFFAFVIICIWLTISTYSSLFFWFTFFYVRTESGREAIKQNWYKKKEIASILLFEDKKVIEISDKTYTKKTKAIFLDFACACYFVWYIFGL